MKQPSPFGETIYTYSRKQAIADGAQVDVSATAKQFGIKFPMFLTRAVWDAYVAVPDGVTGQDEAGRLKDAVWMTRYAIMRSRSAAADRIQVSLNVRNDNRGTRLVNLVATCDPLDVDDPQPAITLMLPTED